MARRKFIVSETFDDTTITMYGWPLRRTHSVLRGPGVTKYYFAGELHRVKGPAVITPKKTCWFLIGKKHRPLVGPYAGPALVNTRRGVTKYYQYGKLHSCFPDREGPAVLTDFAVYIYEGYQKYKLEIIQNPDNWSRGRIMGELNKKEKKSRGYLEPIGHVRWRRGPDGHWY